jgi:hypothetical protein
LPDSSEKPYTIVFSGSLKGIKKLAAGIFIDTSHSEPHFEAKNSEFGCKINF